MRKSHIIIAAIMTAALLISPLVSGLTLGERDQDVADVLFDMGNGETYWSSSDKVTYEDISSDAAHKVDMIFSSGPPVTINGISDYTVVNDPSAIPYETKYERSEWYGSIFGPAPLYAASDVVSKWILYGWDTSISKWVSVSDDPLYDPDDECEYDAIAWGFYPDPSIVPTATPEHKRSWTMIRGDSHSSGGMTSSPAEDIPVAGTAWSKVYGEGNFVCPSVLIADEYAYVIAGGGPDTGDPLPAIYCYDRFTGDEIWKRTYDRGAGYETATPLIVGDFIFLQMTNGQVYKLDRHDGSVKFSIKIPYIAEPLEGNTMFQTGAASMIYDSGVIYFGSSNGTLYACTLDLEILWAYQTEGMMYYHSPTIDGDILYIGAYDGYLYALDRRDGSLVGSVEVYEDGSVSSVIIADDTIMVLYSDGRGMDSLTGGVAAYDLSLNYLWNKEGFGIVSSYSVPLDDGMIFYAETGLLKIDTDGNATLLNDRLGHVKAPITLVNGDTLYIVQYMAGGSIFTLDLDGNITGEFKGAPSSRTSYAMSPIIVIDGWLYSGNDMGSVYGAYGELTLSPDEPSGGSGIWWWILLIIIIAAAAILYYAYTKGLLPIKKKEWEGSYVKRNKRRLLYLIISGTIIAFVLFVTSLSVGPSGNISLGEAFSSLVSYLGKNGGYTFNEIIVGSERLPRVMAVFAVGVGLATAGAMYQAIIRNPLVDPYIMGVSSGAGAMAVAVIAFSFTFFGLFSSDSLYAVPIAAIIGGVLAFFLTMMIAEKAGKSSVNYVLAGVVVGLAFGAIQTLLLSQSGNKIHDAMTWMFGSFANISWNNVWLVFIPALCLSFVPLIWAKEFNVVLLGEEQSKQMGLDVVKFNRFMLILASVLTAVCVSFVGIIGFVGLVVPHVCRMILGSDHRLVLPASIVLGGCMMMIADLLAKMLMVPQELPVGAITTIIGVPVFAYLLIRRGRMYDG